MMKKLIPIVLMSTLISTPAFASGFGVSVAPTDTKNSYGVTIDDNTTKDGWGKSITAYGVSVSDDNETTEDGWGKSVTSYGVTVDGEATKEAHGESAKSAETKTDNKDSEKLNATDTWLKESIKKMDFSNFDTSSFSIISTGSDNEILTMFKEAAKDMANNGWGKIPTDGVFAEGFKGYKLTMADGASSATELFKNTFSTVYNAMKEGNFMADLSIYNKQDVVSGNTNLEDFKKKANAELKNMGDMTEMTKMVNSFSGAIGTEMSQFTNDDLFNSAKKGLDSVNIKGELNALK